MDLEIAVVGGGVAGVYSAWRLQQVKTEARMGLFEYSDRIGGRLYTVTLPGLPHVKAELGGMRYIPNQHIMVKSLVDHLKLAKKEFPMGASAPGGAKSNLFHLRGRHLRLHEFGDPGKVPYNLAWSERGLSPANLHAQVINHIYPNLANLSLCDQMKVKVFGKPLWTYGFWDLMYRVLSNEGYQFMQDAGGCEAIVANANAVTQLSATENHDSTKFLTLRDGFDQLPITLAREFNETFEGATPKGRRVHMNWRLVEIKIDSGEYPYTLIFEPTITREGRTSSKPDAEMLVVRAKKVILALPRRSLELIKSTFFDDGWLQEHIRSVLIQSAFRLFLAYEQPWWRALGLVAGRSVTDLPVRQIYYLGTEGEQKQGLPFMNSLLMTSSNDSSVVPFWKGLENGEPYSGYRPNCLESEVKKIMPTTEFAATDALIQVVNRQVAQVHSLSEIPMPYSALYHSWNEDPYGGGWHKWKANYRLDKVMCRMRKPVAECDIHIVGEAYSYNQGWVEGALDTAESTLQEFFGLKIPAWLAPKDYPLLPNLCPGCDDLEGAVKVKDCAKVLDAITPNSLKAGEEDGEPALGRWH
jgi:lysine 2-monooxygenase